MEEIQMQEIKKKTFLDHILNGIGYMLPCVVAGGILMGMGYMFDDIHLNVASYGYNTPIASFLSTTGSAVFSFMLPILAAFIGNSIAGTGAIPAGLAGGYLASQGDSGFLGAIAAGFLAGYTLLLLIKVCKKLPNSFDGVKTLLLYPLCSVMAMGILSVLFLEPIVGAVNGAMNTGLQSMNGTSKILLGLVVGAMQSVDMGGPVNKTAYLFATASMANGQYDIMAAVLAGGIVPPYVTALTTTICKKKFTKEQRQTGVTNYVIGLAGITEAAIPFWVADPIRVMISCMVGSGLSGALSMAFECSVMAPFGGVFIFPLNSNIPGYILSILAGIAVGTGIYSCIKRKPETV